MPTVICPRCNAQNYANSPACIQCGVPFAVQPLKKSNALTILLVTLGVLLLPCVFCGFFGAIGNIVNPPRLDANAQSSYSNSATVKSGSPTPRPSPTPEPKGLVLVKATWHKGGFGAIGIWKVTIKNESDKQLGDIKFRTAYYSESGNTVAKGGVDSLLGKDTIEKVVPAKKTRTFEVNDGFISDEAHTANFEIVSWRETP